MTQNNQCRDILLQRFTQIILFQLHRLPATSTQLTMDTTSTIARKQSGHSHFKFVKWNVRIFSSQTLSLKPRMQQHSRLQDFISGLGFSIYLTRDVSLLFTVSYNFMKISSLKNFFQPRIISNIQSVSNGCIHTQKRYFSTRK